VKIATLIFISAALFAILFGSYVYTNPEKINDITKNSILSLTGAWNLSSHSKGPAISSSWAFSYPIYPYLLLVTIRAFELSTGNFLKIFLAHLPI